MVSCLAGLCELCGEANELATPKECQRAGLDVEASACVDCLKRLNAAADDDPPKLPPRDPDAN